MDYEDFVQAGYVGLIKAIDRYNVKHESKATFNTFAVWYIMAEMNRFRYNNTGLVHIPQHKIGKVSQYYLMIDGLDDWQRDSLDLNDSNTAQPDDILMQQGSLDYLYNILDEVFDRQSFEYKCFAKKYSIDGHTY